MVTPWRRKDPPVEMWFSVYYGMNSKAKFTVENDAYLFAALITTQSTAPARIYKGTRYACTYSRGEQLGGPAGPPAA